MIDLAISAPDLSRQGQRGAKPQGPIRLGSDEHLRLFCLELLETYDPRLIRPVVVPAMLRLALWFAGGNRPKAARA